MWPFQDGDFIASEASKPFSFLPYVATAFQGSGMGFPESPCSFTRAAAGPVAQGNKWSLEPHCSILRRLCSSPAWGSWASFSSPCISFLTAKWSEQQNSPIEWRCGLNELTHAMLLTQCLTHIKRSINISHCYHCSWPHILTKVTAKLEEEAANVHRPEQS